jgi:hypothetical protein
MKILILQFLREIKKKWQASRKRLWATYENNVTEILPYLVPNVMEDIMTS